MHVTEQGYFKRAVEIAGWPEWGDESERPHRMAADDGWLGVSDFIVWAGGGCYAVNTQEATALIEKHFREWLEEHPKGSAVTPERGAGYFAWLSRIHWMKFVHAETYLKCQCLAIAAVAEGEKP